MKQAVFVLVVLCLAYTIHLIFYITHTWYSQAWYRWKHGTARELQKEKIQEYCMTGVTGTRNADGARREKVNTSALQVVEERNETQTSATVLKEMVERVRTQRENMKNTQEETRISNTGGAQNELQKTILYYFSSLSPKKVLYSEEKKLFWITPEYPYEYELYTADFWEIYFFWKKSYSEVYRIFEVQAKDYHYTINAPNNIGKKNFYINKVKQDDYVRLVIEWKEIIFWIYCKRSYYPQVKSILEKFIF